MKVRTALLITVFLTHFLVAGCTAHRAPTSHCEQFTSTRTEPATTVILIRHAERQDDSHDTPLSGEGRARAVRLAQLVKDAGVDTILVSDRRRTHETASEVFTATGIPENQAGDFKHDDPPASVATRIRQTGFGHVVLVVAHAHYVHTILKQLGGWTVPPLTDFDQMFIITLCPDGKDRLIRAAYPPNTPARIP